MGLQSDISDFRETELRELHELERFYKSLSFISAVEYAASGVTPHRKIHPHQRRVGIKQLRKSAELLNNYTPAIRKAKSFGDLFKITESIKSELKGLGDLWSYDTALRMAFNRGKTFYPQAVFIHGGVMKGIKKIFSKILLKDRTLPVKVFPKDLQTLKPFEMENFLSIWGKK